MNGTMTATGSGTRDITEKTAVKLPLAIWVAVAGALICGGMGIYKVTSDAQYQAQTISELRKANEESIAELKRMIVDSNTARALAMERSAENQNRITLILERYGIRQEINTSSIEDINKRLREMERREARPKE